MIFSIQKYVILYDKAVDILLKYFSDVMLLMIRLYMASIFFQSGWAKFDNIWTGGWFNTVFLFKNIYKVPLFSPEVAAVFGTGSELVFSICLALGVFARIGAFGLLGVTAVITFGVHSHFTHEFWAQLLAVSLVFGPGKFSFDGWIRAWWTRLHASVQEHLESAELQAKVAPQIVCKERPNEKIMLDNKQDPIVKIRLSKRKLIAEPDKIVTVKSLMYKKKQTSDRQLTKKQQNSLRGG